MFYKEYKYISHFAFIMQFPIWPSVSTYWNTLMINIYVKGVLD